MFVMPVSQANTRCPFPVPLTVTVLIFLSSYFAQMYGLLQFQAIQGTLDAFG